jgi:hypothetical protein
VLGFELPLPSIHLDNPSSRINNTGNHDDAKPSTNTNSVVLNSTQKSSGWNPQQCEAFASTAVAKDMATHAAWLKIAQHTPTDVDCALAGIWQAWWISPNSTYEMEYPVSFANTFPARAFYNNIPHKCGVQRLQG